MNRSMQRMVLLNPGPVTLSDRVRAALMQGDWCHREPEFAELTREINAALVGVYAELLTDYDAVMMTGSGTAAVEAMLAGFAPADGETLVLANGVYGERMARILAAQGKPHRVIRHAWIEPLDIERVQSTLDENPGISHLATVHHETTTGRLNDLDGIGAICRQRNLALLLDGVSSFGAEAVKAEAWNLAAIAGTANKCLHGVPGLSFVIARKTLWLRSRSEDVNVGSVYLDLFAYHKGQHGDGYSPFTPAVQAAFALREALAELDESGGWQVRQAEYLQRAARIYEELTSLNVYSLLNNNEYSSVLRSYKLPADCTYDRVHDVLKTAGFVVYAGQGEFASEIFRIAQMGDIRDEDLVALTAALRSVFAAKT